MAKKNSYVSEDKEGKLRKELGDEWADKPLSPEDRAFLHGEKEQQRRRDHTSKIETAYSQKVKENSLDL